MLALGGRARRSVHVVLTFAVVTAATVAGFDGVGLQGTGDPGRRLLPSRSLWPE